MMRKFHQKKCPEEKMRRDRDVKWTETLRDYIILQHTGGLLDILWALIVFTRIQVVCIGKY